MPDAQRLLMKLLVGLGNPGLQYNMTRHNAGFMVVDQLVAKFAGAEMGRVAKSRFQALTVEAMIGGEKVLLMKPTTFMNRSGQSVAEAVRFYQCDAQTDLLVIVDEVYLATGIIRMKPSGGTAGHNGLANIQQLLGSDNYPRLRVGVGLLPNGGKPAFMDQADFVLGRFSEEEQGLLDAALKKSMEAVELFVTKGLAHAMNFANAEPKEAKRETKPDKKEVNKEKNSPQSHEGHKEDKKE